MTKHSLFPLGLRCSHCARWNSLVDAIAHAQQLHRDCLSCQAEILLSSAMLEQMDASIREVRRRRPQAVRQRIE